MMVKMSIAGASCDITAISPTQILCRLPALHLLAWLSSLNVRVFVLLEAS